MALAPAPPRSDPCGRSTFLTLNRGWITTMRSFHRTLPYVAALSLVVAACGDDNGNGNGNNPPTANFAEPTCTALTCTFTDASTDSDGSISSREWTFENGNPASSTEQIQQVV